MRSTQERIARMHERAAELACRKDRGGLLIYGALSGILMVCLVFMVLKLQHMHHLLTGSLAMGSSMLSDQAGAYVLVAVAAFSGGVLLTAGIHYFRKRKEGEEND